MFTKLRQFLGRQPARPEASLPPGERVYAIGDIHGRDDLFENLIAQIEVDDASRGRALTTLVLLGDLIDRGPDSAAVVRRARQWASQRHCEFLLGNHEEMLLNSCARPEALKGFLKYGGRETLESYGVSLEATADEDLDRVQRLMLDAIPAEDIAFIESFGNMVRIGSYAFVHAGVRPALPLEHQMSQDCRWIREPFLSHRGDFGAFVVHGHTITPEPDLCPNRVGIDTGAYMHGTLTALGLQGTDRWFLQAREDDGGTNADALQPEVVPA